MAKFDFITGKEFRESLDADWIELEKAFESGAWKSVQVLAGSIIEAILIDYIVATPNASRPKKDPLTFDLNTAINICRDEKVITSRTSDLCSAVRSYRNLIHPGRAIRLAEEPPSEASAGIARSLIDIIAADVARTRKDTFGLTADQILSKIERDSNCLPYLRHLLDDASEAERERFVLEVLPERYLALVEESVPFDMPEWSAATLARLAKSYNVARNAVGEDTLKKATQKYLKVLREGDGDLVSHYDDAFFQPGDLIYLSDTQAALVKRHILSKLKGKFIRELLKGVIGVEPFLQPGDVYEWLDPIIRGAISPSASEETRKGVADYLGYALQKTKPDVDAAVGKRIDEWISSIKNKDRENDIQFLESVKPEQMDFDFPF